GYVSTAATVSITVAPPPVPTAQSVTTSQDTAVAITLSSTDPNGDLLAFSVTTPPANGELTGGGANFVYTPSGGVIGHDSFEFTVTDTATGLVGTATVSINVVSPPPVASDQSLLVGESLSVAITLSSTDPNGDPLAYTVIAPPGHGQLTGVVPNVTYTPNSGF